MEFNKDRLKTIIEADMGEPLETLQKVAEKLGADLILHNCRLYRCTRKWQEVH